jgi:hypothetical protein
LIGPWSKYLVASVYPDGKVDSALFGTSFRTILSINPGETKYIVIMFHPTTPGSDQFTFTPVAADPDKSIDIATDSQWNRPIRQFLLRTPPATKRVTPWWQ